MPTEVTPAAAIWRRLWVCLCLLWLGAVHAQSIESVLAPGEVIRGHVKVEQDCKACHTRFNRGAQDGLCVACHKDVGEDVRRRTGLHGKRQPQQQCRACHTEHRGRAAQLAAFDHKTFDHRVTDFELHDKHVGLDCAKCHLAGKRWREAAATCVGCHARNDVHKAGLGRKCEDCHNARGWKTTDYDHGRKTRFALLGKHIQTKCDACHADGHFKDTARTCIGCHRKKDEHKGQYGEKCESCHDAQAWKPSTFSHDTDTKYVLKDKHRAVKCAACHSAPVYQRKLGAACIDCHLKDDKHKADLGRQCADCHSERGWKLVPGFDHAKSHFPLLGSHALVLCKDCHADPLYRHTPSTCLACHRKDDKHLGNLGEGCKDCHGEQKWKGVPLRFDHERTKFRLRNAHAANTVKCSDCHETLRTLRGTPLDCLACHSRDDKHQGTLGKGCEPCHSDLSWRIERFDHSRTRFALAGAHGTLACNACHLSARYKEAPTECLGCHRKDDKHKARLGSQCASCHNVRAWPLWEFDHDRATKYRLEGGHRKAPCEACHARPAPSGRVVAAVGIDCLACHRKDDAHEGRFGRRCETCHAPASWRQLRQGAAFRGAAGPAAPASGVP